MAHNVLKDQAAVSESVFGRVFALPFPPKCGWCGEYIANSKNSATRLWYIVISALKVPCWRCFIYFAEKPKWGEYARCESLAGAIFSQFPPFPRAIRQIDVEMRGDECR